MRFDIVLPTIERRSLMTTIESVYQQQFQDWYLWVVVDGGVLTSQFVQAMPPDPRIAYVQKEVRGNDYGASARNLGISQGRSEWIAYIDDDDVWLPNHLTILSECASLHPDANMLRTLGRSFSWRHKSPRSSQLVRKIGPVNDRDILTVGMAHTRVLFEKTSGWQPVDNHDHILWREMLTIGGVAAFAQDVTFEFER